MEAYALTYPLPLPKPARPVTARQVYPLPLPNPLRAVRKTRQTKPERKRTTTQGTRASEDERAPEKPVRKWTESEIVEARQSCKALLADVSVDYAKAEPIGGPEQCGIAAPVRVTAFGGPQAVSVEPKPIINCKIAAAAMSWLETKVQPAALQEFGERVVKIRNAASYVCRRRNNKPDGKLSEHALGNAIDVSMFTLASGKTVTVADNWRSDKQETVLEEVVAAIGSRETPESRFLNKVHAGACEVFSTILGPDADKYHVDHFHLDLGRGGRYLVCR